MPDSADAPEDDRVPVENPPDIASIIRNRFLQLFSIGTGLAIATQIVLVGLDRGLAQDTTVALGLAGALTALVVVYPVWVARSLPDESLDIDDLSLRTLCSSAPNFFDELRIQPGAGELANHVYYLGFLFTLAALAISLFGIALYWEPSAPEPALTITTVVGNNGIALLTTLVGLTLRVLLRPSERDPLEKAEGELAETIENLSGDIEAIQGQIQSITDDKEGSLPRFHEGVKNTTAGVQNLNAQIRDVSDSVDTDLTVIRGSIFRLKKLIERASAETVHRHLTRLAEAITDRLQEAASCLAAAPDGSGDDDGSGDRSGEGCPLISDDTCEEVRELLNNLRADITLLEVGLNWSDDPSDDGTDQPLQHRPDFLKWSNEVLETCVELRTDWGAGPSDAGSTDSENDRDENVGEPIVAATKTAAEAVEKFLTESDSWEEDLGNAIEDAKQSARSVPSSELASDREEQMQDDLFRLAYELEELKKRL